MRPVSLECLYHEQKQKAPPIPVHIAQQQAYIGLPLIASTAYLL